MSSEPTGHTERYDTPWRRLPWTGSIAVLCWTLGLWLLSLALTKAPQVPMRTPPVTARFVELPEPPPIPEPLPPPKLMPPKVLPIVRPTRPTLQRPRKQVAPLAPSAASETQTTETVAAELPQAASHSAAFATSQMTAFNAAGGLPAGALSTSRFPGTAIRAKAVGVIERPIESIHQEENPFDEGLGEGANPGGWMQEVNEPCPGDTDGWENSCDQVLFSRPGAPWCHDAHPYFTWEIGTCKDDLDLAIAAYKRKDFATALAEFKKLAELDYAPAQANLAAMYADGVGIAKDKQQAAYWWRKAAIAGDGKSIFNLAMLYSDGTGVPRNDQQAVHWYRKAAYLGYTFAQYNLGVMYALGSGVARDSKQAAYWYRKAAGRGSAAAQYNLAALYAEGTGIEKNESQAVYWFCKAAGRGDAQAKSSLALMYAAGGELPKDAELVYFCWLLSREKRHSLNGEVGRELAEKGLTPQQRVSADAAARVWKSK